MKLVDLLAVVCVVEGIEVKDKVLNDVVEEVKDGCSEGLLEEFEEEPMYIFYTKKVLSRV